MTNYCYYGGIGGGAIAGIVFLLILIAAGIGAGVYFFTRANYIAIVRTDDEGADGDWNLSITGRGGSIGSFLLDPEELGEKNHFNIAPAVVDQMKNAIAGGNPQLAIDMYEGAKQPGQYVRMFEAGNVDVFEIKWKPNIGEIVGGAITYKSKLDVGGSPYDIFGIGSAIQNAVGDEWKPRDIIIINTKEPHAKVFELASQGRMKSGNSRILE